jgi:hypothetical protein
VNSGQLEGWFGIDFKIVRQGDLIMCKLAQEKVNE